MHLFSGKKEKEKENKILIEQIILEKYNQYYRLAFSYAHNEEDAGDIVQNGAYKALRNSDTLKKPEYAETWIYRIMLNECFQHLKQPRCVSIDAMQEENGAEAGYSEDHYGNIDLQRAIDSLSEKDKAIVILKYFEDKTLEEIAEILNENVNTVKSRLYRSMKKLQNTLSDGTEQSKYQYNHGTGR